MYDKGFVYSKDGKRLLKAADADEYWIPEGVEHIEKFAFIGYTIGRVHIPYTCNMDEDFCFPRSSEVMIWDRPYSELDEIVDILYRGEDDEVMDEYGVKYTKNGKRLLCATDKFDGKEYKETLRAGIVYVRQSPVLIWIISASLFLNAMLVPFNSLQAPLASDVLHRGAEALSLLGITVTLGMLLGSAVYPMVQKRIRSRSILALAGMGIFIFYVGIVICQPMYTSLWGTYLTLSMLSMIFGCTISIAISMISVQFMKWTEESYLARVGGIFNALSVAAMPVTSFLISAVVAFVDIKILFLAVGVIDFIGCIFMVRSKALKQMDEEEQSTVSYTGETE